MSIRQVDSFLRKFAYGEAPFSRLRASRHYDSFSLPVMGKTLKYTLFALDP
jgi:hypothetical protein